MSQTGWTAEDEATFRLLQERRMRARRERQRQARAEMVERMRGNNPRMEEEDGRRSLTWMPMKIKVCNG